MIFPSPEFSSNNFHPFVSCLWLLVFIFPELALVRWLSFCLLKSFFTMSFSQLVSLSMCLHCFCVYVWWILSNPELFVSECCYHSISPPLQRYLPHPLISALVCLLSQHLDHNLPTSSYFTPGVQLHRTRVKRLPSSHLYSLTLPERYSYPHILNTCTVLLYCLICNGAEVFD